MIFKPLSNLSRHAALAKHLWVQSGGHNQPTSQPSFFLTTNQLARQQSQLSIRTGNGFGNENGGGPNGSSTTTASYASICSSNSFSIISPLSSLDDERQREVVESANNGYMMYNHQRSLVKPVTKEFHRRYSVSKDRIEEINGGELNGGEQQDVQLQLQSQEQLDSISSDESINTPNTSISIEESNELKQPQTQTRSQSQSQTTPAQSEQVQQQQQLQQTPTHDTFISNAFASNDYEHVVELYRTSPNQISSIHTFNKVLLSIANICENSDLTPLLDAYTNLLSTKSLLPDVQTYSILITTLLCSEPSSNSLSLRNVKARHSTALLSSVSNELSKNDDISLMYSELAIDLFEASNSIKLHHYSSSIYLQLLETCIQYNKKDKLKTIIDFVNQSSIEPSVEIDIALIKSYGLLNDVNSAIKVFNSSSPSITTNPSLYSAMMNTYFKCNEAALGAEFLQTILKSNASFIQSKQFEPILVETFKGFASIGEYEDCWRWIQQAESDSTICPVSIESLIETFALVCRGKDSDVVHQMFDFMASYKTSSCDLFNDSRCDYIMFCIHHQNNEYLYKAIHETHIRNGIWDETTLYNVVDYLIRSNQPELALDIFQMQSFRIKANSEELLSFGEEVLSLTVSNLKSRNLLTLENALSIANSAFMTSKVFANSTGGGVDILQSIWDERKKSGISIYSSSKSLALDILHLHCKWIQSSTQSNSLGDLSIPFELVQTLKENLNIFIQDVINQKLIISNVLYEDVESSLQLLNDYPTADKWNHYFIELQKTSPIPKQAYVEESTSEPFTVVNLDSSTEIIGYATTENGILESLNILRETFIRKELVTPDAILFLLEAVASSAAAGAKEIVHEVYSLCLQYLPPPTMSPQSWDAWTAIHRSIVTHSAESDYKLAENAYHNLVNMGSCPDATGYGQLMAHAPTSSNRDEAVDAMRLFNEARASGIALNTFLYNVLLSKLSKARKLKEAVTIFNEMDRLNIKKSNISYGTMISACCRAGDGDFAMKLFNEMESSPSYVPKIAPFNIMLQYFVHTKQDREASLKVYEKLRQLGLSPSAHTYKLLIDMYSTIQPIDIESADQVLLTIKQDGNEITSQHFAALLFSRGVVLNDLQAAQEFYDVLVHQRKIRPDKVISQALLESYVVNDKVKDTTTVLKEMVSYGIDLNAYMANILIRGWASISIEKSLGLFDYILQANIAEPSSYESIIRALIYHKDFISANNVLNLMRANRYPEAVVQKVDILVRQGHNNELGRDRILLDSIFRHDAHRLNSVSTSV